MILTRIGPGKYIIETGLPWTYMSYLEIDASNLIEDRSYFGTGYYTNLIFSNLHPVDIIPMIPKPSSKIVDRIRNSNTDENTKKELEHTLTYLYEPDYAEGVKQFNRLLKMFKIIDDDKTISFIRLYATDNTQLSESITSNYEEIPIKQLLDSFGNKIKQLTGGIAELFKMVSKSLYLTPDEIDRTVSQMTGNDFISFLSQIASAGSRGLKIDFPKVWADTQYSRTLNINVTLSSPYGHPEILYQWVYAPLIALLLLGSPLNIYGFVGIPLYVRVKAYGLQDIVMGAIQSITINRGGQNTVYNAYKQPTKLELTISIVDLYSQFSIDYTNLKDEPLDTKNVLTNPIDASSFTPTDEKLISYQPTLASLINSLRPYKDAYPISTEKLTHDKHIHKKSYFSFTRKKI